MHIVQIFLCICMNQYTTSSMKNVERLITRILAWTDSQKASIHDDIATDPQICICTIQIKNHQNIGYSFPGWHAVFEGNIGHLINTIFYALPPKQTYFMASLLYYIWPCWTSKDKTEHLAKARFQSQFFLHA